MSYILDALRKSEHERQVAAGQGVGMLYPIEIQRDRKLWFPIGMVVIVTMLICTLIWWMWSQPINTKISSATNKPITVLVTPPQVAFPEVVSNPVAAVKNLIPETTQKKVRNIPIVDVQIKPTIKSEYKPSAVAVPHQTAITDQIKDLPTLNITGYIHNEQSGSLAMINNQLVREGEEITPGLRLVKILDNGAILSYKGYVFSR